MSDKEFIQRPFISHDGTDKNGIRAEVKVITGHALVDEKTKPKSRDSKMVQFKFSTPTSNHPTGAWLNKEKDAELFEFLEEAYNNERSVDFRIEIHRKANVDRSLPFDEIAPPKDMEAALENTFKNIVAARSSDDDEWIVGSQMLTSFKEDMDYGGARKATDEDVAKTRSQNAPASNVSNAGSGNYREDSPYKALLGDGSVNTNSFALMTPVEVAFFVRSHISAQGLSEEFSTDEEESIVKITLSAIGATQKRLTGKDTVEVSDYSYKIAYALVKGVLENFYPLKAFEDDFDSELKNHFKMVVIVAKKISANAISYIEEVAS